MRVQTPAEQALYCTVRIETCDSAHQPLASGTAFIFTLSRGSNHYPFLITNKHVIEQADGGRFFFTKRANDGPAVGNRLDVTVQNFSNQWHGHPDPAVDIAVMPLGPILHEIESSGQQVFFRALGDDLLPTEEQLEDLDALEEVVFVGYPNGIYDSTNLLPIIRRGTTASPVSVDYEGRPHFLIDASVFPGSSGSPVLLCNLGGYAGRTGFTVGTRVMLLGVISQVLVRRERGDLRFISIPSANVPVIEMKQMIDLGLVIKARTIREAALHLLNQRLPE